MATNGQTSAAWGYGIEGHPSPMLHAALRSASRNGHAPHALPACHGEACDWARRIAECLKDGTCRAAVVFCDDPASVCCVANKVAGIRAAPVATLDDARRVLSKLGANLLAVAQDGRTYYECRALLRLCEESAAIVCPPGIACVLKELDGHAHR